jgi:PAS domain S-box-containing protein
MIERESEEGESAGAESVLAAMPIAVAQCSSAMRFVWVSQRYADWIEVPREQIVGRSIVEVLGAECLEHMRAHVDAALAGRPTEREAEVQHRGRGPRWVHIDCVPTFDASGAPDGWIETLTDVTERRRAEGCLRASQSILQSFYDSTPYYMGIVELEGETLRFRSCNRALARELGVPPERLVGRSADEFGTSEQIRVWLDKYQQARREGAPVEFEYQHQTPLGTRWVRATAAYVGEDDRGRARFSFVAEEVTERKKILEALRDANRSKDEFLAMLGHELRNPLSPIVTALELLKLRGDAPYRKTLEIVDRQVQYLVRLVDDLLDVSRVTRGQIAIEKRLLRLQDVVAQGAEMAMPLIAQRRHRLEVHLPSADLRLSGDEGRLAQVVGNLLTNAAKYTEPGGHIVVEGERRGANLELVVRDDGIGIAPDLLPFVFDPFVQGRVADRSRGGLGIGLTIVRNLVELHGGTVRAESAGPGRGSAFTVRLPAELGEPPAVHVPGWSPPTEAQHSRRVLVVDDNEDALALLGEVLRGAGNLVVTAREGAAALEVLRTFPAEVAILDIGLPGMDGYELAQRMREQLGPSVPRLIALTGYGQEMDRARALAAGFAQHLTKPVDIERLLGALEVTAAEGAPA